MSRQHRIGPCNVCKFLVVELCNKAVYPPSFIDNCFKMYLAESVKNCLKVGVQLT